MINKNVSKDSYYLTRTQYNARKAAGALVDGAIYYITDEGANIAWGSIQGTLANQTDLKSALDAKISATMGYEEV